MEQLLKEFTKNHISPFLKTHGFKKKSNRFYKKQGDFTFCFCIPVDREYTENGAYFHLICGIYSDAFEQMMGREIIAYPKGYDFILNYGFSDITGYEEDRFLIETTTNQALLAQKMLGNIQLVVEFFEKMTSSEVLIDHCLAHNYLVHYEDLMRYLAIKQDDEKMEKYLSCIKEKLYKSADRAHTFYVQKSLKLKAEYTPSVSNASTASAN